MEGPINSNPLLQRLASLRSKVRNAKRFRKATWRKTYFRLNVFPSEFAAVVGDDFPFEEEEEGEVRHLKTKVGDLEAELERKTQKLVDVQEFAQEQQNAKVSQMERVAFLSNRLGAVEKEADESSAENQHLRARVSTMWFSWQQTS